MEKKKELKVYKVLMEAIARGMLKDVDLPVSIDRRRLTIDEIKKYIVEEFEDAKNVEETSPEEEVPWGDAELSKEVDWVKSLDLKEFFNRGKKQ